MDFGQEFDVCREWICQRRKKGKSWESIKTLFGLDLAAELSKREEMDDWPSMSPDEWLLLVAEEVKREEDSVPVFDSSPCISDISENNAITKIPDKGWNCWPQYKKKLREKGFRINDIAAIENTIYKTVKKLNRDTSTTGPIKGLIVGSVQSGKTANMIGLMSMAADFGWNMFIVLSGMVENLRMQTQSRMFSELTSSESDFSDSGLVWYGVEKPSPGSTGPNDIKNVDFTGNNRYFTVCLKNSSRLKSLLQWLYRDGNKARQMKIVVIDDEADQASINTADISKSEKTKINELITNIVTGKGADGKEAKSKFRAMNYIGYTATPYANILNEGPAMNSLYPEHFITLMANNNNYFGPDRIFGSEDNGYEGLDIIRKQTFDDIKKVNIIHKGKTGELPESLKDALCWFVCSTAVMRLRKKRKPVSMLIHSSYKTNHHDNMAQSVSKWMKKITEEEFMERCKSVWQSETEEFSFHKFQEQYPDYNSGDFSDVSDYPEFYEIETDIRRIFKTNLQTINLGDEGDFHYGEGIHICIDNCKHNTIGHDGSYLRLVYPDKGEYDGYAPAFLVIGGTTLSRGMTLEGLVATYFLRMAGQADTLLQMQRWFGYRKGYELLPRIWMTEGAYAKSCFISSLDKQLRDEIVQMEITAQTPSDYAPRVRNTPSYNYLRITAKNKTQSAVAATMDFSGANMETYLFSEDERKQKANLSLLYRFIDEIGNPERRKAVNRHSEGCYIWRGVKFKKIEKFVKEYSFAETTKSFLNRKELMQWLGKQAASGNGNFDNWNIILAGLKSSGKGIDFPFGKLNFIHRARLKSANRAINIKVLRDPRDFIADVDLSNINDDTEKKLIDGFNAGKSISKKDISKVRIAAGLDDIPQLVIYVIDKDSKAGGKTETRENLNANENLVGFCLNMPGIRKGVNYVETVSIDLRPDLLDEYDLEE